MDEILTWGIALLIAAVTVSLHIKALKKLTPLFDGQFRLKVFVCTSLIIALHFFEILVFACIFWFGEHIAGTGTIEGAVSFTDYAHFSAVSYTSLGFGDLYPTGSLRILVGVEALIGLTMIAWTGAFSYSRIAKST